MGKVKLLESTGNQTEDAKLLAELGDNLRNTFSLEEARERERAANAATASGESGNTLTDEPRIKGQALAVVIDNEEDDKENGKKETRTAISKENRNGDSEVNSLKVERINTTTAQEPAVSAK
jgi:hypothetical protein